jgi:hypothetical protein
MVRAVRFKSERLPVLIQTVSFCPSGTSAPILCKSSEAKPSLSICPVGLPPRAEICLLYTVLKWNARRVDPTSALLPNSSLFTQAQLKRLCKSNRRQSAVVKIRSKFLQQSKKILSVKFEQKYRLFL